jgi:hypothetical protein
MTASATKLTVIAAVATLLLLHAQPALALLLLVGMYWLPTLVAAIRRSPDTVGIAVLNLFGFTVIAWVVAFALAVSPASKPVRFIPIHVSIPQQPRRNSALIPAPVIVARSRASSALTAAPTTKTWPVPPAPTMQAPTRPARAWSAEPSPPVDWSRLYEATTPRNGLRQH